MQILKFDNLFFFSSASFEKHNQSPLFLVSPPVLVYLDLSENGIETTGADRLAGVLGQCAALVHLDLSENGIGPDGAENLVGVLGQWHRWFTSISSVIRSDKPGQRVLLECWGSVHH